MDSLFGLPAHPLLVHGAVVLVPLAALGAAVIAASASMRRRFGVIVVGLALVAFVFTFLAKESGESLEEKVDEDELVEDHAELGGTMPIFAFALLAASGVLVAVEIFGRRMAGGPATVATGDDSGSPPWIRPVTIGLAALTVVVSVAATYQVALVGHSGAKATWQEVQDGGGRDGAVEVVDDEERGDAD
jgi:uncharacterized membrane protein